MQSELNNMYTPSHTHLRQKEFGKIVFLERKSSLTFYTESDTMKIIQPHYAAFLIKTSNKNFRSPGSEAEPDPRKAKDKLAVLTGVISR